jgi:hypothetical protein
MSNEKYNSFLYNPPLPFHKMSLRELCDHNKITKLLDKFSLVKIKKIEQWSEIKRARKFKKFLKKHNKTIKKNLKKSSKRHTRRLKLNKDYFLKLK